jgi:hypothetical protein
MNEREQKELRKYNRQFRKPKPRPAPKLKAGQDPEVTVLR